MTIPFHHLIIFFMGLAIALMSITVISLISETTDKDITIEKQEKHIKLLKESNAFLLSLANHNTVTLPYELILRINRNILEHDSSILVLQSKIDSYTKLKKKQQNITLPIH